MARHLLRNMPASTGPPQPLFPARVYHPAFNLDTQDATVLASQFEQICIRAADKQLLELDNAARDAMAAVQSTFHCVHLGRRTYLTDFLQQSKQKQLLSFYHVRSRLCRNAALLPARRDRSRSRFKIGKVSPAVSLNPPKTEYELYMSSRERFVLYQAQPGPRRRRPPPTDWWSGIDTCVGLHRKLLTSLCATLKHTPPADLV